MHHRQRRCVRAEITSTSRTFRLLPEDEFLDEGRQRHSTKTAQPSYRLGDCARAW